MSPELAVSMGLVANELISNAFKHAFLPESHLGKLKVSFVGTGEDAFQLVVEDNGSNFDATLLKREDHRLGLRLVKGLVRQMKGEVSLEMSILGGSKFTVNVIKAS